MYQVQNYDLSNFLNDTIAAYDELCRRLLRNIHALKTAGVKLQHQ